MIQLIEITLWIPMPTQRLALVYLILGSLVAGFFSPWIRPRAVSYLLCVALFPLVVLAVAKRDKEVKS